MRVEFALNNRELVKAGEKRVRANDPIKMKDMKGAFSLNNLLLGTVWPFGVWGSFLAPDSCFRGPSTRASHSQSQALKSGCSNAFLGTTFMFSAFLHAPVQTAASAACDATMGFS